MVVAVRGAMVNVNGKKKSNEGAKKQRKEKNARRTNVITAGGRS
jgi:hypothetical protein